MGVVIYKCLPMKSYVSFIKKERAIITMENRTENIGVRVTPKELAKVTKIANKFGMKAPQYIRWVLFYKMEDIEEAQERQKEKRLNG